MNRDALLAALMVLAFVLGITGLACSAGWMMGTALVALFVSVVLLGVDTAGGLRA